MIGAPSQIKPYTLIYSGDPSLALPDDTAEREKALELARETGNWDALIMAGEKPTLFQVRPLAGRLFDYCAGEVRRNKWTEIEGLAFALRLALREIVNFGSHQVKFVRATDEIDLASTATIDALYAIGDAGRDIIEEIGTLVFAKGAKHLSPKS